MSRLVSGSGFPWSGDTLVSAGPQLKQTGFTACLVNSAQAAKGATPKQTTSLLELYEQLATLLKGSRTSYTGQMGNARMGPPFPTGVEGKPWHGTLHVLTLWLNLM